MAGDKTHGNGEDAHGLSGQKVFGCVVLPAFRNESIVEAYEGRE